MKMRTILGSMILVMGLAAAGLGQSSRLQDLLGTNGASAENAMEQRGYVLTHSDRSGSDAYGYWWSSSAKKCVVTRASNNQVRAVTDTEPIDCNQRADSGMSNSAKTAVGVGAAAAIIGAIALAHKAHHHDDDKHSSDTNAEAEYDRGYRDGLYSSAYHNYSNTDQYKAGYQAGVDQRNRETSHSSGRGGYAPHAYVNDLMGARGSSGESELQNRGFRNVAAVKGDTASYTFWWNGRTGQCIQVETTEGRYSSLVDVEHPRCR